MPRKYVHPLIRQIDRSKKERNKSNAEIADRLCITERTYYRKRARPETFTLAEIDIMADLFGWTNVTVKRLTEV